MSDLSSPFPYDIYHFWAAGAVARSGGNPYDNTAIHPVMIGVGWPPEEGIFGFLHPFWSLWIFSILSLIPFPIVKLVWEGLLITLIGASVALLLRPSVRQLLAVTAPTPFLVFATLLFPPVMSTLHNAQTNPFMLIGTVVWLTLSLQRRHLLAGMALSLTAIKPQLFIPFYLWVFLSNFKESGYRCAAGFAVGLLLQSGLSLIFAPNSAAYWLESMQNVSHAAINLPTPALSRLLTQATGFEHLPLILIGAAAAAAIFCALRSTRNPQLFAISVWLPLSLLVAPYTWTHGFLALLPAYFIVLCTIQRGWPKLATYGVFGLACFGAFEMQAPFTFARYMVVLPIILLCFGVRQAAVDSPFFKRPLFNQ